MSIQSTRWKVLCALAITLGVFACTKQEPQTQPQTQTTSAATTEAPNPAATASGTPAAAAPAAPAQNVTELKIEDLKVGTGAEATPGKEITANYTGWLTDGKKFDSSYDTKQPIKFRLGEGRVIPGWDKGLVGMKVGGKRKLTIPPQLGYGAAGSPPVIPPNATLIFEVELLNVQ